MTATVIFDLDGTLADTSGDLIAAANACFRDLGLGDLLERGRDDPVAVRGAIAMLRTGFARVEGDWEDEIARQRPRFLDYYDADIANETTLYPGVREAVDALRGAGVNVGICTNKPEGLAEKLMTALEFRAPFASLVGADTLSVSKPEPEPLREAVRRAGGDPARCCLVGDTDTDRKTARAAGVASVLVTFGPAGHGVADLRPEALLHHYDDLGAVVQGLAL